MLLYIGNQENLPYLQTVANQLGQPVCTVPAPAEAYKLPELARPMYTHYVVDIRCYNDNSAALIGGLKNLVSRTQGKIMLLAVDMNTQTPVISELIYAGFGDILYYSSNVNGSSSNCPKINKKIVPVLPVQNDNCTYPLVSTEPLKREADPMRTEPMRELPWIVRTPVGGCMGQERAVSSEVETEDKGSKKSHLKILALCGCCIVLLAGIVGVTIQIMGKQSGKSVGNMELIQRNSQGLIPVIPEASRDTPSTEPLAEPTSTPVLETTPVPTTTAIAAPVETAVPTKPPQILQIPTPVETPVSESEPTETPTQTSQPEVSKDGTGEEEQNNNKDIKILKVSLPSGVRIVAGNSITLTPKYEPTESTGVKWIWTSSNTDIVTVNNGRITAVKPGEAEITVSLEDGPKASCSISVAEE